MLRYTSERRTFWRSTLFTKYFYLLSSGAVLIFSAHLVSGLICSDSLMWTAADARWSHQQLEGTGSMLIPPPLYVCLLHTFVWLIIPWFYFLVFLSALAIIQC